MSYYDNKFPALTPESKKEFKLGKTNPQFFQASVNPVRVALGAKSPSRGEKAIVTMELSHEDVAESYQPIEPITIRPRPLEIKNATVTSKLKQPQGPVKKRDNATSIKTGSFNTSQSQYFEKTNTSFKPMYYMR